MTRALLALIVIAGCGGGDVTAGRVEASGEAGTLVIRDSMHVLELPFTHAWRDHMFVQFELPDVQFPGRLAFADDAKGELVLVWITRLGAKRPENIQRWFDEKMARLTHGGGSILKDEGTKFGEHPARITDANTVGKDPGPRNYARVVAIDIPEHDLEILVVALVKAAQPSAEQQKWLDDVVVDMRAIKIAAAAK